MADLNEIQIAADTDCAASESPARVQTSWTPGAVFQTAQEYAAVIDPGTQRFALAIVLRPQTDGWRALRAEVRDKFSNLALEAMTL